LSHNTICDTRLDCNTMYIAIMLLFFSGVFQHAKHVLRLVSCMFFFNSVFQHA
jgi:hypothetical protein